MDKFEIMPLSWSKRREHTEPEGVKSFSVEGFCKKDNAHCVMSVEMLDGSCYTLRGRINVNDQNGRWTVHGMNPHGFVILLRLV